MSHFQSHAFHLFRRFAFSAPRRPRHPLLRVALGVVGIVVLLALVVVGVFVGAAMLGGGLLWRLWTRRGKPDTGVRRGSIDGHYHVVGKAHLPLAR